MSRLQVPLKYRTLWATGDVLIRPELDVQLRTNQQTWIDATFRVDSGTEMTTFSAFTAAQLDLQVPRAAIPGAVHQQTGLAIHSGYLWVRVVGMDPTVYVFPCFFLGDPTVPPNPNAPPATVPRSLLGLSGVIDKLGIAFDGSAVLGAPHGTMIIEKK
jgi:hypothetical protein